MILIYMTKIRYLNTHGHFLEGYLMVVASGEQKTYFTLSYA